MKDYNKIEKVSIEIPPFGKGDIVRANKFVFVDAGKDIDAGELLQVTGCEKGPDGWTVLLEVCKINADGTMTLGLKVSLAADMLTLVRRRGATPIEDDGVAMLVNIVEQMLDGATFEEATANPDCTKFDDLDINRVLDIVKARYAL